MGVLHYVSVLSTVVGLTGNRRVLRWVTLLNRERTLNKRIRNWEASWWSRLDYRSQAVVPWILMWLAKVRIVLWEAVDSTALSSLVIYLPGVQLLSRLLLIITSDRGFVCILEAGPRWLPGLCGRLSFGLRFKPDVSVTNSSCFFPRVVVCFSSFVIWGESSVLEIVRKVRIYERSVSDQLYEFYEIFPLAIARIL